MPDRLDILGPMQEAVARMLAAAISPPEPAVEDPAPLAGALPPLWRPFFGVASTRAGFWLDFGTRDGETNIGGLTLCFRGVTRGLGCVASMVVA